MTNEQLSALQSYVDAALPLLGLGGWRVKVIRDSGPDEHQATLEYFHGRREAELEVAGDFFERVARSQRELLAHELAHLVLAHLDLHARGRELRDVLGGPAFELFQLGWRQLLELAVDTLEPLLVDILVDRLPGPVFPVSAARPDDRHDFREPS